MAKACERLSASVSSLVDKVFDRKRKKIRIGQTRVECIYGPPEMLEARRTKRQPDPDPEPVDLYGPPVAGEDEPEEESAMEEEPINRKTVPQEYPVVIPDEPVCIYGPPPAGR